MGETAAAFTLMSTSFGPGEGGGNEPKDGALSKELTRTARIPLSIQRAEPGGSDTVTVTD